jgi:hypothetical protein
VEDVGVADVESLDVPTGIGRILVLGPVSRREWRCGRERGRDRERSFSEESSTKAVEEVAID